MSAGIQAESLNYESGWPVLRLRNTDAANKESVVRAGKEMMGDLDRHGYMPVSVLQGGMVFESVDPTKDTAEMKKRPFVTLRVRRSNPQMKDKGGSVYKSVVPDEDPSRKMRNEVAVLSSLAPYAMSRIPDVLRNKITLPTVSEYREDGPRPYVVENFFDGEALGSIHTANPQTTLEDALAIANVIEAFSGMTVDEVKQRAPSLSLKPSRSENYADNFALWQPALETTLGRDYVGKLAEMLPHAKEPCADRPLQFVAVDINPANVLKDKEGRLAMIDWERVAVSQNPALDYNFFLASLWSTPEVRDTYLQFVLERNKHIPNFAEALRADYIFNRGCGELNHWTGVLADDSAPQSLQREALLAIDAHRVFLQDAIDRKGVWSPKAKEQPSQIYPA